MYYNNPNDYWMPDMSGLTEEEQEEVRAKTLLYGCGMYVVMAIVLFVAMLLTSCTTTKYVPVVEHHTDTLIQTKIQKDIIYVHDSVTVSQKGDTVWVDRWHTKWVNNEVHDTTYVSKTDTVPVPYPVETIKEVEKPLAWWQKTLMWLGMALIGIIAVWIWRTK